jgi:NADPH:quinone reductase-like Zn-dependent oxidoreductase
MVASIRAAAPDGRVDAFIDTHGGDYVEIALNELGVAPERVDTIIRFDAASKYGIKAEGNEAGASVATLTELLNLIAVGDLAVPIAATYPLADVRQAYQRLAGGHIRGKIALIP